MFILQFIQIHVSRIFDCIPKNGAPNMDMPIRAVFKIHLSFHCSSCTGLFAGIPLFDCYNPQYIKGLSIVPERIMN